jgi:hypothetical protein
MYHVELRHFPHNAWRFNLTDQQLHALLAPWVRQEIVDFGERKWSPHVAKLTVLEGPHLDVAQLSMGRGWRAAQRVSDNVTEQVLEAAKNAPHAGGGSALGGAPAGAGSPGVGGAPGADDAREASPGAGAPAAPAPVSGVLSDPVALGVQLAALLGSDPIALLDAWRAAAARAPALAPSESLALAEHSLRSAPREQP